MRSTCPSCLSQVEHNHSDPQVHCTSCNEVFSPFLTSSSNAESDTLVPVENAISDFSESSMAFKEIIDFGEQLDQTPAEKKSSPSVAAPIKTSTLSPPVNLKTAPSTDFIMTTGDLSSHLQVSHWYHPLSRMVLLGMDESPLEKAFQDLRDAALALGANAVTGIRCSLSPDNKRALLLGTPVRWEK